MNSRLRAFIAPFLLILLLLFSGCTGTNGQIQAITDAIIAYSDYYIEVRNLSVQVKEQSADLDSKAQTQDYTILVDIPDYTSIDLSAVSFTPPEPSLAVGSVSTYQKQSALALRQALEQYAGSNTFTSYVQLPVTFSVVSGTNGWTANITSQSKLEIQQTIENLVQTVLEQNEAYQADYRLMEISSALADLLTNAFGGAEYARLMTVQDITQNADTNYTATISYPDPQSVYNALGTAYQASFNHEFYGDQVSASLSTEGIAEIDLSTAQIDSITVTLSYNEETGESALLDDGGLSESISAARVAAEADASDAVNSAWRVEPLEAPSSGTVLEGESAGNTIKFKTSTALGAYFYVRFYAISGEDVSEEGTLQLGVFIKGGKSAKFSLPSGYYRVSCLVGDNWYGLDHLFGNDSKTYSGGNAVQSRDGYQNNISFE
jgi:hypothetical protein